MLGRAARLSAHLRLDHARNREDADALAAKGLHERAVLELADDARVHVDAREPLLERAAKRRSGPRHEQRRARERARKAAPVALRERRRRHQHHVAFAEKVREYPHGDARIGRASCRERV